MADSVMLQTISMILWPAMAICMVSAAAYALYRFVAPISDMLCDNEQNSAIPAKSEGKISRRRGKTQCSEQFQGLISH